MLRKGIGERQCATRIELYCVAKAARSSDVVPGIPLASAAPGAPAVEPLMASGHAGAAGAGGAGAAGAGAAGAGAAGAGAAVVGCGELVELRLAPFVPTAVELPEGRGTDEPGADCPELFLATAAATGPDFSSSRCEVSPPALAAADELATMSLLVAECTELIDGPAHWTKMTAATTAVATNTGFFNVCTPIQRLHCPPIETSAYRKT